MASATYFIKKLKVPVGTELPKDVDGWLAIMEQFTSIQPQFVNAGAIETVFSETKPTDTTVQWIVKAPSGKALGAFMFLGGFWLSVEHEKGDFKYQNLTGTLHPHWRFADNSINPGPINGVTIPTVTNRGLVAAATGGKYNVGDTGGADDISLPHKHINGQFNANGHKLLSNQQGSITVRTLNVADSISGGDPTFFTLDINGVNVYSRNTQGFGSKTTVVPAANAASTHEHVIPEHDTQDSTPAFDNRSLYFGARLLIYVGVE